MLRPLTKLVIVLAAIALLGDARAQSPYGGNLERGTPLPNPLFPADNWWNQDITAAPVDPQSADFIAFVNNYSATPRRLHPDFGGYADDAPGIYGFPYIVVDASQPKRAVQFEYADESDGVDPGTGLGVPFYPIPDQAINEPYWIEGGYPGAVGVDGDRHMLIVDRDNGHLYELFALRWDGSQWTAGSGAFFNLASNARRPEGWTSADAAGLAILPGLVRYDEVAGADEIRHAFRVTVRATNGYVYPASHRAGSNPAALPMGARLRLKASKDLSGYHPGVQKIFRAMQRYGLIVADNGSDMFVSGAFDPRWDNDILNPAFRSLNANDFDVIELGWQGGGSPCNAPPAPQGFTYSMSGNIVRFDWTASTNPTDFLLEAGTFAGAANAATLPLPGTSREFTVAAPPGVFYVRARARNACGVSPPSNEVVVTVGGCSLPAVPGNFRFTANGPFVTLAWDGVAGADEYILDVGSAPGLTNLLTTSLGNTTAITAVAPPGTYYGRMRARNGCGSSGPSNEIVVVVN